MPPEDFLPAAFSSADSSLIGEESAALQKPENRVLSLENPRAGGFHMIAYDAPDTDSGRIVSVWMRSAPLDPVPMEKSVTGIRDVEIQRNRKGAD